MEDDRYCLCVITARGGSKGLPGKNLAKIGGKTLVARAVEHAVGSGRCTRVICSTDSEAIAEEALRAGADVPFLRPAGLATDAASSADVMIHAVQFVEGDAGRKVDDAVLLQPTTPLRTAEDVRRTVDLYLHSDPPADSATSVCEVTESHPAWLRTIRDGVAVPYFDDVGDEPTRQQDFCRFPTPYMRNGAVYVMGREVLFEQRRVFGLRCMAYVMPAYRSADIDDEYDLVCARAIWAHTQEKVRPAAV